MKVRYFADTDTMLIEFRDVPVAETRDLDENTILDLDAQGNIRSITIEHASTRAMPLSSRTSKLPHNQPMERTPPCCALRRRSSAR